MKWAFFFNNCSYLYIYYLSFLHSYIKYIEILKYLRDNKIMLAYYVDPSIASEFDHELSENI